MSPSCASLKLAYAVVVLCMVVVAPHAEATITCGTVVSKIGPCMGFLKGGAMPSAPCCTGIKSLNAMAASTPDRQTACTCLKTAATSVKGIDIKKAAGLPAKCGVNIPYVISPSIDCSKVH